PDVIFADEPTGNLDSHAGAEVLSLLGRATTLYGQTIIMVTHDPMAASHAHRVVLLKDGRATGEVRQPTRDSVVTALSELSALCSLSLWRRSGSIGRASCRSASHTPRQHGSPRRPSSPPPPCSTDSRTLSAERAPTPSSRSSRARRSTSAETKSQPFSVPCPTSPGSTRHRCRHEPCPERV